jgi:hypothetical protein
VTQPKSGLKVAKGCTFRAESAAAAVAITPATGVLYVADPRALHLYRNDTDELKVEVFIEINIFLFPVL